MIPRSAETCYDYMRRRQHLTPGPAPTGKIAEGGKAGSGGFAVGVDAGVVVAKPSGARTTAAFRVA